MVIGDCCTLETSDSVRTSDSSLVFENGCTSLVTRDRDTSPDGIASHLTP